MSFPAYGAGAVAALLLVPSGSAFADSCLAVLEGSVRITALDYEGGNFSDDFEMGDLWYLPSGVSYSLQGPSPNGS